METISLNGKWNLKGKNQALNDGNIIDIEANVPGCVQLDLSNEGILPKDLFLGLNVKEADKFEEYEWWYEKTFDCPKVKKNVFLVFEGVDTIAEYYLNGQKIGESDNMYIANEFKIDDYLTDGENRLVVHIKSATLYADEKDYTIKLIDNSKNLEARHIRKAPHSFGWDIMPRLVTAGLWRDVKIEIRDKIYFSQTFFYAPNNNGKFYYVLEGDHNDFKKVEIEVNAACGESELSFRIPCNKKYGIHYFWIKDSKKWFPYGYGEPNLYEGTVKILSCGEVVHEENISFGVRTVELDRRDPTDNDKGQFRILINGVEIMCKGSNWVPLDAIHSRDAQRYDEALALVKDIGCNILRCWGGNVYEDHKFFDFCDKNGIMVWQDFAMACANYPEDDDFKKKLEKEATSVIRKLRNHPSIIMWAGDNEVDSCTSTYNPDNNTLTREVLPKCIELNDLGRPYLPSSPYITSYMYEKGERPQVIGSNMVEDHLWGPRDYFKSEFYSTNKARFVSETGYHGCASLESIKKFITPDNIWPYLNDEWTLHSTDNNGRNHRVLLMEKQVNILFGIVPDNIDDYILASQISQAEAKKYFIERMRVGRPDKTGIIWWNLLDGWPQMSDAVVDYYFNKKLAYHYIKRSQAPFAIIAGEPSNGVLPIYACNDTLSNKSFSLVIKNLNTNEVILENNFEVLENRTTNILNINNNFENNTCLIFEWYIDGQKYWNHYLIGEKPIDFKTYCENMKKYGFDK